MKQRNNFLKSSNRKLKRHFVAVKRRLVELKRRFVGCLLPTNGSFVANKPSFCWQQSDGLLATNFFTFVCLWELSDCKGCFWVIFSLCNIVVQR
jgi:hypothetical protein